MTAQIARHVRAGPPPAIDTRIPHRDWPEAGEDMRVSKAEREDDYAGQPFGWLVWACLITAVCALLGWYGPDLWALAKTLVRVVL